MNVHIEGGPSSGKSTLHAALPLKLRKIPEIARKILELGKFGGTIAEVLESNSFPDFQRCVVRNCATQETLGNQKGGYLLDASTISAAAYVQDLPSDDKGEINRLLIHHWAKNPPGKVFVLEPLPYVQDGVRHGNSLIQKTIYDRIIKICESQASSTRWSQRWGWTFGSSS